jgi:hypothetical protein
MKNAIRNRTCGTCQFFHCPHEAAVGFCIYYPPTPFIVGMQPSSPLVDPRKPGAEMAHVVRGYFPTVGKEDGCGQHQPDVLKMN